MCGFILWKRARLLEFRRVNPDAFLGDMLRDQDGFTVSCGRQRGTGAVRTVNFSGSWASASARGSAI